MRIKDLFYNDYKSFKLTEIIIFVIIIILIVHFCFSCYFITRKSFYSYNISFINIYLKIYIYVGYNIISDLCFSNFCLGLGEFNPNFINVKCPGHGSTDLAMIIISVIFGISNLILTLFIITYYYDSFFLSQSYYSKITCNYDYLLFSSCFINSILLTQDKFLTKEVFIIYNIAVSIFLFYFYITHYLYYNITTNTLVGIFHVLYMWTSIFGVLFAYVDMSEKGVIYLLISIFVCLLYLVIHKKIKEKIIMNTPFNLIDNQYYLLYYCHYLITKIILRDENQRNKALLSGIIRMHVIECPNPLCPSKNKNHLFLPLTNQWSNRKKENINDEIFLKIFIVTLLNYYVLTKKCLIDIYLNLSLYYLVKIGNYCEAI